MKSEFVSDVSLLLNLYMKIFSVPGLFKSEGRKFWKYQAEQQQKVLNIFKYWYFDQGLSPGNGYLRCLSVLFTLFRIQEGSYY